MNPIATRLLGATAIALGLSACSTAHPIPVRTKPPVTKDAPVATLATGGSDMAGGGTIAIDEPPPPPPTWGIVAQKSYARVVQKVVGMPRDGALQRMVRRRGLSLTNVMWEDTGRFQGSSVGPNITDLTLQVRFKKPGQRGERTALLPVIRHPNFSDKTGDVPADKFFVRVGNHESKTGLRSVALTDVLRDIKKFASRPETIKGSGNLLAKRDSHFLVSAQAVFLPIPKQGKAEFNPAVFNYQSAPGSPAVLTMLVTRQGTSMTVVENKRQDGGAGMGQELYFNTKGMRSAFTAERKSDVKKRIAAQGGPKTQDDASALEKGADVMFLIQVPLKHRARRRMMPPPMAMADDGAMGAPPSAPMMKSARRESSNVEQAVLGHGKERGRFREGGGMKLERDARFPIRITVQFYKATSNGVVDGRDLDKIASSIGGVYEHADFVGSLVLPRGDALRPTAWNKMPQTWFPW